MELAEIVAYVLAVATGGGLYKLVDFILRARQQKHEIQVTDTEVARQLRDELRSERDEMRSEMETIRDRLTIVEGELSLERQARMKAEMTARELQMKINLLISMINDMRKQQGLEPMALEDL